MFLANQISSLLLTIILILGFGIQTTAQVKCVNGIYYPDDYLTRDTQIRRSLEKSTGDTLTYKHFEKIVDDFDVIKGCGNYDSDQTGSNIASSDNGYYLAVWEEKRTGIIEIQAQLFDSTDHRVGDIIEVSDDYANWNSEPHITFNRVSREFIITWAKSGYDVQLQRVTEAGTKIGSNYQVNTLYTANTDCPSAAVGQNGNIFVAWYSGYFGSIQVHYRLFNKNMNPIIDEKILTGGNYDDINSIGREHIAAADNSGNFIVVWSSYYNNKSDVVIRRIKNTGEPAEENRLVSDSTDTHNYYFPSVTDMDGGYCLIIWTDDRNLKGRIYKPDSGFVSSQFTVSDTQSTWFTYSASSDNEDNFFVAFTGNYQYAQIINKYGTFIGTNIRLEFGQQPGSEFPVYPRLSDQANNSLYYVYQKYRKNDQEAMLQKFDLNFKPIGYSVKLNTDVCSSFQTDPVVKYNKSGKSLVVWIDRRDGTDNLYAQVLDANGNTIGNNFLVNDTSETYWISNAYIKDLADENFLVSYSGGSYLDRNLFLQKISAEGEIIGDPVKVTDIYNYTPKSVIQQDQSGNILLCWVYNSYYSYGYIQKFSEDLQSSGPVYNFLTGYDWQKRIYDFAINKNLNILVVWADYNSESQSIGNVLKGMIFNEKAAPLSDTLYIDTLKNGRTYMTAVCAIDSEGNTAVEWSELNKLHGYPVYAGIERRYSQNERVDIFKNYYETNNYWTTLSIIKFKNRKLFAAWDSFESINSIFLDDIAQTQIPVRLQVIEPYFFDYELSANSYSADLYKDRMIFCYEAVKNPEKGYDIWSNIQLNKLFNFEPYTNPPISEEESTTEIFSSPYPNPVTTELHVSFILPRPVHVTIAVYNILGQKILDVQDGMMGTGNYTRGINTAGLASGIYFLHYKGLNTYTKKFLVVK